MVITHKPRCVDFMSPNIGSTAAKKAVRLDRARFTHLAVLETVGKTPRDTKTEECADLLPSFLDVALHFWWLCVKVELAAEC